MIIQTVAPSRLIPLAKALALVALVAALLDPTLWLIFGANPIRVPRPVDPVTLSQCWSRVAAFERMQATGEVAAQRLVAVVGLSTVRWGLDPAVLAANDPEHRKWLILGGFGSKFTLLKTYCEPLLRSDIAPRLVVLGVHPLMVGIDEHDLYGPIDPVAHIRNHQPRFLAMDFSWIYRNISRLDEKSVLLTGDAADGVRSLVGLPMYDWYEVDEHPWGSWNEAAVAKASPEYRSNQLAGYRRHFVPEGFDPENDQVKAFRRLVEQLRSRGSTVICVLMPESSQLRNLYPAYVQTRFDQAVASISTPQNPLRVVDLRDSVPDEMFYDCSHLNAEGEQQFSKLLAPILVRY